MKKFYLLFLSVVVFTSCGNKLEKAIKDYEQIIGSDKVDHSMNIISLKKVKEYTGADSLDIILTLSGMPADSLQHIVDHTKERVAVYKENFKLYTDSLEMERNNPDSKSFVINYYTNMAKGYEDMVNNDWFERIIATAEKALYYSNNSEKVLANLWQCTYTIKNPFLNTTQEITKTYLFNSEDTEVIIAFDDVDNDYDF